MKKKLMALFCLVGMLSLTTACSGSFEESSNDSSLSSDVQSEVSDSNSEEIEHTDVWSEPTYSWDGDQCTAARACTAEDCTATETETVTGVYVKDANATCTENEKGHYEATFENEAFTAQATEADSVELADTMVAHVYGAATYTWVGDQCTATRACTAEDCTATEMETVTGVYVKDTDASCTVNETGHYEATFENEAFTAQATEADSVEVPDTATHTLGETKLEAREMVTRCSVCGEAMQSVPVYTTFTDGEMIGNAEVGYFLGEAAIPMTELESKALHFEFKFETDGSFNICLLASDWANVTGYFTVTKSGDSVTSTIGRIVALEDGWYAWELNKKAFAGDGVARATDVGLIYTTTAVTGTVSIDFTTFKAVDQYRAGTTFTDGEKIGGEKGEYYLGENAVPMTELSGKALRFEFKFETDGSFNICILASDWANITGYFTVSKSGDSVTSTIGRIVDLGDGWYAWELNERAFAGDGASRATEVGLIYTTSTVNGTVTIDFTSFAAVDMYRTGTTYTEGEVIGGTTGYQLGTNAISMTELSGKALRFEFKFETDGSFNICILDSNWANITGYFTVTKSGDSVTSTIGRIVDLGDGWCAWEQNASEFAGDGASRATNIGLIYTTTPVTGTVVIDWTSISAVDAYQA